MTFAHYALGKPWLRVFTLFRRSQPGFRILTFHDVPAHEHRAFEHLLDYVEAHHGFLSPAEVEDITRGASVPHPRKEVPCLITFDDGYASNAEVAEVILNRRGIRAVFFVCPELMDLPGEQQNRAMSRFVYEGHEVPPTMKFMSWAQLQRLAAAGHTIGSHTLHHQRLSAQSKEIHDSEIVQSGNRLEERLSIPIRWFAYPFGTIDSIDEAAYKVIRQRYSFCCTGLRGLNRAPVPPLTLLRDPVDLSSPFEYQQLSLCGGLDFLYARSVKRMRTEICPA